MRDETGRREKLAMGESVEKEVKEEEVDVI